MSAPQHAPASASAAVSGRSPRARRLGCLALALVPFVLIGMIVEAPSWIDDYRLARMVERIQAYPLPDGAEFGSFDPQAETTGGDSGDCWYTIRFPVSTDRPVHEVLSHYRKAKIEDPDGDLGDFTVTAWAMVDEPGGQGDEATATGPVIIDVDGVYSGSLLDGRCS
ncbi:hypothetical protein [Nonomuraea rubra]|uniref:Uncharacterized protein n=1 Tax=Nonomuraea rubra TaxID=46180 RepID=A0A7X0U140_9ACTN|nr:hypothetical protein [Nonomuraea rubra]MBB6551372.1 hypothetical protein [Nonomuraea rubra]